MISYQPRTDEMAFILSPVLQAPRELQALPPFVDVDPDLMRQILDEAGKICRRGGCAPEPGWRRNRLPF